MRREWRWQSAPPLVLADITRLQTGDHDLLNAALRPIFQIPRAQNLTLWEPSTRIGNAMGKHRISQGI